MNIDNCQSLEELSWKTRFDARWASLWHQKLANRHKRWINITRASTIVGMLVSSGTAWLQIGSDDPLTWVIVVVAVIVVIIQSMDMVINFSTCYSVEMTLKQLYDQVLLLLSLNDDTNSENERKIMDIRSLKTAINDNSSSSHYLMVYCYNETVQTLYPPKESDVHKMKIPKKKWW